MFKGINMLVTIIIAFVLTLLLLGCFKSKIGEKEAKVIIQEFYADNVPEPIIDRHLLTAGKAIVPYLIVEIQNKDMPKRGYGILALGKIGDRKAVPVLIKIIEDHSELVYFRIDALRAIWHIDRKLGETYAAKFEGENREFDRTIQLLKEEKI
jgi:HEAT repeat protein